jgi:Cu/Ag efflux protein CusF
MSVIRSSTIWVLALTFACSLAALAGCDRPQDAESDRVVSGAPADDPADPPQATGRVESIDAAAGTLTISHTAVESLGLPADTTEFEIQDPRELVGLIEGQRVRFLVHQVGPRRFQVGDVQAESAP